MHKWIRSAVLVSMSLLLVLTSTGLQAAAGGGGPFEQESAEAMVGDFVFVRPLGVIATALGSVFFVGSLPFSVPGGNVKAAFRNLVSEPASFTFGRPLGKVEP